MGYSVQAQTKPYQNRSRKANCHRKWTIDWNKKITRSCMDSIFSAKFLSGWLAPGAFYSLSIVVCKLIVGWPRDIRASWVVQLWLWTISWSRHGFRITSVPKTRMKLPTICCGMLRGLFLYWNRESHSDWMVHRACWVEELEIFSKCLGQDQQNHKECHV